MLRVVEGVPAASADRAAAVQWALRCRLEQGYVGAAVELARTAPERLLNVADAGPSLRLWRGFLTLYDIGDRLFNEVFTEFEDLCGQLSDSAGASDAVIAVATDLRARAEAMRFALSGQGPQQRGRVVAQLATAADAYRAAGLPREAIGALRRAATFGLDGLAAERARARTLLEEARDEARKEGLALAEAAAALALADVDFQVFLDGGGDRDQAAILAELDTLAGIFRASGHAFGDAEVASRVGRALLAHGREQGLGLARAAAEGFASADALSAEQRVWAALNAWYTMHGDPEQSRRARVQESRLASQAGFAMAAEVRVLDEANQAFRSGEVALARSLLVQRFRSSASMLAANRLMLVTSANAVGLREEAQRLVEQVIADLTATGASLLLGEALIMLATMLTGQDDDRAAALLSRAADVAHAAESPAEEAKYRGQLAWASVVRRKSEGVTPVLTDPARAEFDQAETLLTGLRSLEAAAELVTLYQFQGQAAFFAADWEACGTWFTKAESVASSAGLLPHLAFVLCHQGLALIQLARSTGPATYDGAAGCFERSRKLFEQVELRALVWQVIFFRALCDIEAARSPTMTVADRTARLERASGLMEEASGRIDQLRESSEQGSADRRQHVWMAFSVDKQTFYGQGFQLAWDSCSDPGAAWKWLERMKGRALLDALSDGSADSPGPADSQPPGAVTPGVARRSAVRQSEPPAFGEIRALLTAQEEAAGGRRVIVAEYLCTPERTLLFGARADWARPRVAPIALDHARLGRFAATTFRAPGGVRMMMQDLDGGGIAAWQEFSALLAPLAAWSDPDDVIYLVPHNALHDLPLHTLPLEGMPLIERNPVCYVPAAAVLRHALPGRTPRTSGGAASEVAAVFGDASGDLPHARREADAVAALLGVTSVLGSDVTRERVLRALEIARVVHIAGHGNLSIEDGFDSYLDLAGHDRLRAADLLGRQCRAGLVVLSGCETGVSEQRPGDEVVGFARALLLSGGHSILASQWRVADSSTQELLHHFHQAARDPANSLADALRQAIREIRTDRGYSHLYHWGGFALVGSWR
jgi:hypothetical protein